MVDGFAVDVIENLVEEIDAQIVVIGAVSRTGLQWLLIGSTAERMVDRRSCDLLIVKPHRFPDRVRRRTRGPQIIPTSLPLVSVMH